MHIRSEAVKAIKYSAPKSSIQIFMPKEMHALFWGSNLRKRAIEVPPGSYCPKTTLVSHGPRAFCILLDTGLVSSIHILYIKRDATVPVLLTLQRAERFDEGLILAASGTQRPRRILNCHHVILCYGQPGCHIMYYTAWMSYYVL
jgi:hypothetical protein